MWRSRSAPRWSRTASSTCRPRPASSPIPTRAPNGWRRSTRRARCFGLRRSRTLPDVELVHAREGVGKFLLEALPVHQIFFIGKPGPVTGEAGPAVGELEAEELEPEPPDHVRD